MPRHLNQPRPPIEPAEDDAQPQSAFDQLRARQQAFVRNYLLMDGNATQAYLLAYGCTYNSAAVHGHRLINDSKVAAAIQEQKARLRARLGISATKILQERARLAFANMQDFHGPDGRLRPVHELDVHDTAAIRELTETVKYSGEGQTPEVSRRLKLHDKEKSLQFLERLFGLDARSPNGPQQVTIEIHFGSAAPPSETPRTQPSSSTPFEIPFDEP